MKILFTSHMFYPDIGGIEKMSQLLASGFVERGHEVVLVTNSESTFKDEFPFLVVRNPSVFELIKYAMWSDIFYQNNICLHLLWPLILIRRPLVIAHRVWITGSNGNVRLRDHLKQYIASKASNIAISSAVASHLSCDSKIILNPYDDRLFRKINENERFIELVYVGRLIFDKGVHVLLDAMRLLMDRGLFYNLVIVGSGEYDSELKKICDQFGLSENVKFLGMKVGEELVEILNQCKVIVVPSLWKEPFGIVALEGMACGCIPVVSEEGGLVEAIGHCGLSFENGNSISLADNIELLLTSESKSCTFANRLESHLTRHKLDSVISDYLSVIEGAEISS